MNVLYKIECISDIKFTSTYITIEPGDTHVVTAVPSSNLYISILNHSAVRGEDYLIICVWDINGKVLTDRTIIEGEL